MAKPTIFPIGTGFPPGLNTADPDTDLKPNETPDAYGFDLTVDGKIKKGTAPTGTARVKKIPGSAWTTSTAYIVDDVVVQSSASYICLTAHTSGVFATDLAASKWVAATMLWHHNHIWRINSNVLEIGAANYNDHFYGGNAAFHKIQFSEDAQAITAICPIEPDSMFVSKSTGGYVLRNLSDTRGYFQRSDIIQEMACAAATYITEVNNVVYVGNADGIMAYENFKTKEVSRKLRTLRATLGALALTADYERGHVILGSTYVYDTEADKWFKYSGSSFRYTTPRLRNPNWAQFSIERVLFVIEHGDTDTGYLEYQTRYEDEEWSPVRNLSLPYAAEKFTTVSETLAEARSAHRFQLRVTSLDANKYIKEIQVEATGLDVDDYST